MRQMQPAEQHTPTGPHRGERNEVALTGVMSSNLDKQGFGYLDAAARSRYLLPLRFTPAVATVLIGVALAFQSYVGLGVMALVALSGALFPRGMVFDVAWNLLFRHLWHGPTLPPTPAPRRFSYAVSAALLAGSALALANDAPVLGFALAGVVALGGAVLTTSLWCLGSWLYRVVRALARRPTLSGPARGTPEAQRNGGSVTTCSTDSGTPSATDADTERSAASGHATATNGHPPAGTLKTTHRG